jgi:hypothetical protein
VLLSRAWLTASTEAALALATSLIRPLIVLLAVDTSPMLRLISWVVAVCSSTALAIVVWYSWICEMTALIWLIASTARPVIGRGRIVHGVAGDP